MSSAGSEKLKSAVNMARSIDRTNGSDKALAVGNVGFKVETLKQRELNRFWRINYNVIVTDLLSK